MDIYRFLLAMLVGMLWLLVLQDRADRFRYRIRRFERTWDLLENTARLATGFRVGIVAGKIAIEREPQDKVTPT